MNAPRAFDKWPSQPIGVKPEAWLAVVHEPQLGAAVPEKVQALFETARGMLAYGYFFYPLCTLALDQLYRILEAAVSHKCSQIGCPKSKDTFDKKLRWIRAQGFLCNFSDKDFKTIRDLRNATSHPHGQWLVFPSIVGQELINISALINSLFKPPTPPSDERHISLQAPT